MLRFINGRIRSECLRFVFGGEAAFLVLQVLKLVQQTLILDADTRGNRVSISLSHDPDASDHVSESQRDSITQPRVARHELPWVGVQPFSQP